MKTQLDKWQTWVTEVKNNQHDEYLKEIHLYETLETFTYHLDILKGHAIASLSKDKGTKKIELQTTLIESFGNRKILRTIR